MKALHIKNLTKKYGDTIAVDNIDLEINSGDFFGLLGHNGAGKTTTINCVTGINNFNQGKIEVFGVDVQSEYRDARRLIGLSPQEFNVDIFASASKILDYVGGYFGMNKKSRNEKIHELIQEFDFDKHKNKPFQALSGGLKRRVVLMRALMNNPELLILDEPTAGVDIEQRYQLWSYLEKLHKKGKTIVLTSHYLEEIEKLCSNVAIMNNGKIKKQISKAEFSEQGLESIYLQVTNNKE